MFINEPGNLVPNNKIIVVPIDRNNKTGYSDEIIEPLKNKPTRDWFNPHYYYCLPIGIGNQYGFLVKSMRNFTVFWNGTKDDAEINFLDEEGAEKQSIINGFRNGVVTIQNHFSLKTPIGINLMTIQPPNMFIEGCTSMTGVIETDQIRRDFTFNLKVTVPNRLITINKGDPIGAFIPIQRYFVENFELGYVTDFFSEESYEKELEESMSLGVERNGTDKEKPHMAGRRYFNGLHSDGNKYQDHQKRIK